MEGSLVGVLMNRLGVNLERGIGFVEQLVEVSEMAASDVNRDGGGSKGRNLGGGGVQRRDLVLERGAAEVKVREILRGDCGINYSLHGC